MESMTTTTDPLSPARVEVALETATGQAQAWRRHDVPDKASTYETLAALARAPLDATKREPPAGLAEVIEATLQRVNFAVPLEVAEEVARAVEEFLTSHAAMGRAQVHIHGVDHDQEAIDIARRVVRAALGMKEELE